MASRLRVTLLVLAAAAGGTLSTAAGAVARSGRGRSPALFNREAFHYASGLSPRAEARRYSVMALQAGDARGLATLRRWNPRLKLLVYVNIKNAETSDPLALTVCTALPDDLAHHPDWFLLDASGRRISGGGDYVMNLANPGYRRACATHAVGLAMRFGFDGVFFDGVDSKLQYDLPSGAPAYVPALPNDVAWQGAVSSLLSQSAQVAHAHGLIVVANIGGSTPALWRSWNSAIDGAEEESWTDGGYGLLQQLPWWRQKLGNVAWSEAHHKLVLLHSYNAGERANVYGLASMLLVANGNASYSTSSPNYLGGELWFPEYSTAVRLGPARGPFTRRPGGVYQRVFAHGIVLVNPTAHSVGRFGIGPGAYSGSGLTRVRSVSLGPTSGLILLRVSRR